MDGMRLRAPMRLPTALANELTLFFTEEAGELLLLTPPEETH